MVTSVHNLSVLLVVALELDLLSYQARAKANLTQLGRQLPRTRFGWLKEHYSNTIINRNNDIIQAIQTFNRSRGFPVDTTVFKGANQYARCLCQIEVNEGGEVVYRGANDTVWSKILRK